MKTDACSCFWLLESRCANKSAYLPTKRSAGGPRTTRALSIITPCSMGLCTPWLWSHILKVKSSHVSTLRLSARPPQLIHWQLWSRVWSGKVTWEQLLSGRRDVICMYYSTLLVQVQVRSTYIYTIYTIRIHGLVRLSLRIRIDPFLNLKLPCDLLAKSGPPEVACTSYYVRISREILL